MTPPRSERGGGSVGSYHNPGRSACSAFKGPGVEDLRKAGTRRRPTPPVLDLQKLLRGSRVIEEKRGRRTTEDTEEILKTVRVARGSFASDPIAIAPATSFGHKKGPLVSGSTVDIKSYLLCKVRLRPAGYFDSEPGAGGAAGGLAPFLPSPAALALEEDERRSAMRFSASLTASFRTWSSTQGGRPSSIT